MVASSRRLAPVPTPPEAETSWHGRPARAMPALAEVVRPLGRWALGAACLFIIGSMPEATMSAEITPGLRITVVYNNVPHAPGLTTAWGFGAVVEAGPDTLLFDTGGDAPTLLANMTRLDLAPERTRAIVLSRGDHAVP